MNRGHKNMRRLISQYGKDLLVLALCVLLGIALAERPRLEGLHRGQFDSESAKAPVQGEASDEDEASDETAHASGEAPKTPYTYLAERNIFVSTGSYEPPKGLLQIPENPYNLVAVLKGNEFRAVFKEFTGNIVVLKVGDRLIDGAVVEAIGNVSVTVRKEDVLRDYRLYEVKGILTTNKAEPPTKATKGQ